MDEIGYSADDSRSRSIAKESAVWTFTNTNLCHDWTCFSWTDHILFLASCYIRDL